MTATPTPFLHALRRPWRTAAACGLLALSGLCHAGLIDRGNGVVYDDVTGLDWEQAPNTASINWIDANTHVATLALGGGGWRLPHRSELEGMYAQLAALTGCSDCTGDQGPFTALKAGYWTDLTYWAGQAGAYYVGFWRPNSFAGLFQTSQAWVWGVREGSPVPEPGSALLLATALIGLGLTRRGRRTVAR